MSREGITNHFTLMNLILEQQILDTNTLFEIIQTAIMGNIHPSLLGPEELLRQFRDIKIWLPIGTDLPIEIN